MTEIADLADSAQLEAFKAGDRGAFEHYFRYFSKTVFGCAYRMTLNRTEADEITQEAFIKCFRNSSQFRGKTIPSLGAWLLTTTRRTALDFIRKQKKDEINFIPDPERPDEIFEKNEIQKHVHETLAKLKTEYRDVVVLFEIEQLPIKEIVHTLGLSESNVKARLHRSRRQFREEFSKHTNTVWGEQESNERN
ncbi:MAG: sigma-70 family RNA polymerase sigma factor [Candidatus Lindowbacteria bacterium]|nr:sigma-70 family RNA polymerase sigma factor [Candidatus Lindowbacteria bacterium]